MRYPLLPFVVPQTPNPHGLLIQLFQKNFLSMAKNMLTN